MVSGAGYIASCQSQMHQLIKLTFQVDTFPDCPLQLPPFLICELFFDCPAKRARWISIREQLGGRRLFCVCNETLQ